MTSASRHLEDFESKGELSDVCAQTVIQCVQLARLGPPNVQRSVVDKVCHKMVQASDKKVLQIDLLHQFHKRLQAILSCGKQYSTQPTGIVPRCFVLKEILQDSNSTFGRMFCIFGSRTFVPLFMDVQEASSSVPQQGRV